MVQGDRMLDEGVKQFLDAVTVAGSHPAKYNVFDVASRAIADRIPGAWVEAGACGDADAAEAAGAGAACAGESARGIADEEAAGAAGS